MVTMTWKVKKMGKKNMMRFEQKTNFGNLICTFNHTIRPTGFILSVSESATMLGQDALYSFELVTEDYLYPGHIPSVHLHVLNTTMAFRESQCLSLLKPYLDELTGGVTLARYYRDEYTEKAECLCYTPYRCNCDEME